MHSNLRNSLVDRVVATNGVAFERRYLQPGWFTLALKRAFDVTVAVLALVLLAPLFGMLAALIKLDSSGPVFYRQIRVGRNRRQFRIWKFRKMFEGLRRQGASLTKRRDPRLTTFGSFLERTKLDELPQLLNIFWGNMSVVGPRPEVPKFVDDSELWDVVLSVKPGIFGPNQLRHRNESELYPDNCDDVEAFYAQQILPEKLEVDAAYARSLGLFHDFWLILRCVLASLLGVVTWQTIVSRRWQIANFITLSILGIGGMVVAHYLTGQMQSSEMLLFGVVAAAICKPLCLILFKVPKALATSLTADDLSRAWWCAVTSSSLIACASLFTEHRDVGRLTLWLDMVSFISLLVLYKLTLYKAYVTFYLQESRELTRRLLAAAVLLAPLSAATVVTVRFGSSVWTGPEAGFYFSMLALFAVIRPLVILFRPIGAHRNLVTWLFQEWKGLFLGTLVGSALMVFAAVSVNERSLARSDIVCDACLYLGLMTGVALWYNRMLAGRQTDPDEMEEPKTGRERLLVVGTGIELSAFISALACLPEDEFEVCGIVTPHDWHRNHTIGKYPVLGEIGDLPELVGIWRISRTVVVSSSLAESELTHLRNWCNEHDHPLVPVDLLHFITPAPRPHAEHTPAIPRAHLGPPGRI